MNINYADKIREILKENKVALNALSPEVFAYKPKADKWSKKEILGHLIDSAYNNHQRFLRAEKKGNLIFEGYDQVEWVKKNNYQNRKSEEIIDLFFAANRHLAQLIFTLNDEVLNQKTTLHNFDQIGMRPIEKGEHSSLAYLIEDYIFHLEHHLRQII